MGPARLERGLPLLLLAACSSVQPGAGGSSPGIEELQQRVQSGVAYFAEEPCLQALLLGVLDDADAALRLERLALNVATSTPATSDPVGCRRAIALSRTLSRARRGELALEAEAQHPLLPARAFAERLARSASLSGRRAEAGPDRCVEARRDIAGEDVAAEERGARTLLEAHLMGAGGQLVDTSSSAAPCALRPAYLERLLDSARVDRARARAMLAAALLWEHHPPVSLLAQAIGRPHLGKLAVPWTFFERAERERREEGQECLTDADCSLPERCIKPAGLFSTRGVCGQLVDPAGIPSAYPGNARPCRFDGDCPMGSRCRMITALDGVCVRRGS